ncbi:hypothetical protein CALCODRAFT_502726 [Calocera cornea HHB12733]|uniref:Uncharacterized protein n=1 Tax=Calocera cornea HHB12733 TaxID=1353952 RepID=A0A165D4R4_9BASI|nr:hypothetical protein CALCODRAFT_502726 [Calocera cornea HHB12733]
MRWEDIELKAETRYTSPSHRSNPTPVGPEPSRFRPVGASRPGSNSLRVPAQRLSPRDSPP